MGPADSVYEYILEYNKGSKFPVGEKVTVVAASSYLNFVISNNVVVAQKYWKEGLERSIKKRDAEVKTILEGVFSGRKIIMLDPLPINYGNGGVHCTSLLSFRLCSRQSRFRQSIFYYVLKNNYLKQKTCTELILSIIASGYFGRYFRKHSNSLTFF